MRTNVKIKLTVFIALLLGILIMVSCRDRVYKSYEANIPIYMTEDNFRNITFVLNSSKEIMSPGKIYIKDQYLFINEYMEGIHIFDNTDPANPVNIGFLDIIANVDMAIKENILYVDSYTDLLSFDISDPSNPVLVDRDTNIFEFNNVISLSGFDENLPIADYYPEKGVIIGWEQNVITIEDETQPRGGFYEYAMDAGINTVSYNEGVSSSSIGIGGSMARFTIYDNYLYTLQDFMLTVYDISIITDPVHQNNITLERQAETLFPAKDHLFIGTTTGMMIFGLSNPSSPNLVSEYDHITSCDPVIVYDDKAYVTMSSGSRCWGNTDQLDVVNVSNLNNPYLLKSYTMSNPKGLAIDNNTLFLCDGFDGLKIYDISDTYNITGHMINHFPEINTFDVIAWNNVLIMVGADGIFQYDYSNLDSITQLSVINVNQ